MNRFSQSRTGYKMPGVDKPYYDPEIVFWYTNGVIACGPRRLRIREFKKVRCPKTNFHRVRYPLPYRLAYDRIPF